MASGLSIHTGGLFRANKITGGLAGVASGLQLAVAPRTYQAETTALVARFSVQPTTARKNLIDNMIISMKNSGVWTLLDRLYICAYTNQTDALLNWKQNAFNGTISGSITFVADQGFTGDGVSAQITYGALGAPITANNLALGLYCRTNVLESKADMGGGAIEVRSRAGSGVMSARLCDASANSAIDVTTSIGWSLATIDPSNTANRIYYRGTNVESASSARSTIVALPGTTQGICGVAASTFSTKQIAAAVWAQNLTAQNNTDLYNAILTYLQAIGAA